LANKTEFGIRSRRPAEPAEDKPELGGGVLSLLRTLAIMLMRQPRWMSWILPGLWMGLIWFVSGLSDPLGSQPSRPLAYFGNLAHPFEFGVLALLFLPTRRRTEGWIRFDVETLGGVVVLILLFAAGDEIHQAFVPGRHSSALDWLADATGVYCTLKVADYVSRPEATSSGVINRCLYGLFLCVTAAGLSFLGG